MTTVSNHPEQLRFADFEFDCHTGDLRRNGNCVKLQPQPAKILTLLLRRPFEVVTRQELAQEVWGTEIFVDFEGGLNYGIRQIRTALNDDADNPRFIETLPKRGYRFIALVSSNSPVPPAESSTLTVETRSSRKRIAVPVVFAALACTVGVLVAIAAVNWSHARDRWFVSEAPHRMNSLAVLPLRNLSGDPEQDYFSDGMTDELITELAQFRGLRVISHTSVERYRGAKTPLPEIARELGVDAVVEGTVLRSGDHVHITAQLIDGQSDRHLWAESYERDLRDVVRLQNELARQIATAIGISVTNRESATVAAPKRAVDPVAYEAYLKGSSYFDRLECRSFENALAYFQKAIDKDPNFAPAYSGLADAYFTLGDWRCFHQEHFDQAEIAANKAIELDPGNAHAHAVLAEIGFSRDWNWIGPAKQFSTAIDLDPNYAIAHSYFGMFLVAMGKKDEGLAEERKALEIDPFSDRTNQLYTWTLYLAGKFDEAIDHAKHALSISTSYGEYYWLGQCYEKKGMPDQAMKFYLKAMSGVPEEVPLRRTAYDKGGLAGYWQEDEQIRRRNNQKVDAVRQAMYYCHRGEKEKAIAQLQLAYEQHVDGLQFLKAEPVYDGLRDDSRFQELLARLGL